ncbi:hypothetical protein JVT61DRAFT_2412 [Boletus reticuloceps]|uniref:Uncharacterized protein n=1 Tax=Boletus reticuloceps TaxID=495285 RepID=A0A8I2YQX9_9AGAM|nr:hypothetical protein JVT61DRAFT_2412 [Boletus reticuloceps]
MAAIYAVYTSPSHPPVPNHLPTLIVTPHGQPTNILYSYLHTNYNTENYLLTPSPQGDLCVAKLFPPRHNPSKSSASDPGHSTSSSSRVVRCEASRNLKWSITNTGISKPNPNAAFWSMFYFAYAGHNIPPKRIEFGKIQKNPPGPNGGGTRISITGKTPEEKAVWQTLGEGNEDCVEWVVLCAALNLLDDEIVKAAEKNPPPSGPVPNGTAGPAGRPAPVALHDPGAVPPAGQPRQGPPQQQSLSRGPSAPHGQPSMGPAPGPGGRPPQGFPPPRAFAPGQGPPLNPAVPGGYPIPPQGYGPGQGIRQPPPGYRPGMQGPPGSMPPQVLPAGRVLPPQRPPQQMPSPSQVPPQGVAPRMF